MILSLIDIIVCLFKISDIGMIIRILAIKESLNLPQAHPSFVAPLLPAGSCVTPSQSSLVTSALPRISPFSYPSSSPNTYSPALKPKTQFQYEELPASQIFSSLDDHVLN